MFGLLEGCKLNNANFGEYIEDIKPSQAVAWLDS